MPTLHELQRDFRSAVFDDSDAIAALVVEDGIPATERLDIYRNNVFFALTEALRLIYPAVDRLVGAEFFDLAAARFVRAHPPRGAWLYAYGAGFGRFLQGFPPAAGVAYLSDVARLEWALSRAANAPDAPALDLEALARTDAAEHGSLRFAPHPSLALLHLRFPADAIAEAVLSGDEAAMATVDLAGGPVRLAVHRGREGVEVRRLSKGEWLLTRRLRSGEPLGIVLRAFPRLDGAAVLADHLARGRFAGFALDPPGRARTRSSS